MTRSEMAAIIRKVAEGSATDEEWQTAMVNHYSDIKTEHARSLTVRACLEKEGVGHESFQSYLTAVAQGLESQTDPKTFYFRGMEVGILDEFPAPVAGRQEVGYMPFRGPGHYELHQQREDGKGAFCEYMRGERREQFLVHDCPSYGHLLIENQKPAPTV